MSATAKTMSTDYSDNRQHINQMLVNDVMGKRAWDIFLFFRFHFALFISIIFIS